MEYEIRPYRPGDETRILETFNAVFSEGNPDFVPRTLEQWYWEFRDNPAGNQIMLAVTPDGRVVCQYCCLPFIVNLRGERVTAGCGIDSFVDPGYRRGLKREGVFLRTARTYFREIGVHPITAFGYGFPNEKAYRIGVRMLKYREIRKPQTTLFRNLWEVKDDAEVGGGRRAAVTIEAVDRFGPEFDRFWESLLPHFPMATWRDATYLNWRYRDCPWIPYRAFAARDPAGALRGFCVVRPDWQGHPILAVPELLTHPEDDGVFAELLRFVTRLAREAGQQRVEFWLAESSRAFDMACRMGFRKEGSPFNLVGRFYREDLDLRYTLEHWYYTLGDVDLF